MATAPGWAGNNLTGPWWVFPASGTIQRQSNPILRDGLLASGWAGFDTQEHARAFAQGNAISTGKGDIKAVTGSWGFVKAFLEHLADGKMWRSLGWLALGVLLIAMGLILWLRKSGAIPGVVPVPV
jgi:hypothetical protein